MPELSDRELDCFIAEKMMGWKHIVDDCYGVGIPGGYPPKHEGQRQVVPRYSTDRNAAAQVLERIADKNLEREFIQNLESTVLVARAPDWDIACWIYLNSTPRQLCEAAKKTIEGIACDKANRHARWLRSKVAAKAAFEERATLEGGEKTNANS